MTSIVDVTGRGLIDIVEGRTWLSPALWLLAKPEAWRRQIRFGVLDLSGQHAVPLLLELDLDPHARAGPAALMATAGLHL